MNLNHIISIQLEQAARIKDQFESLTQLFNYILGGSDSAPVTKSPKKCGKSAAGVARVGAAQNERRSKINAAKSNSDAVKAAVKAVNPAKMMRKMSAAGRAAIKAAHKARGSKKVLMLGTDCR